MAPNSITAFILGTHTLQTSTEVKCSYTGTQQQTTVDSPFTEP